MVAREFNVDPSKAIAFQVGHLGEAYQEWVHQPIVSKEAPRLFENDLGEWLTRTAWWAIPVIWGPVACWFISLSVKMGHTLPQIALLLIYGVFIWTFLEYTLHRFFFHMDTKTYWGNTLHYFIHGAHHKYPNDRFRLVFPPLGTAILLVPIYGMLRVLNTASTTPAIFGGGLLTYVVYDVFHYYLHHSQPKAETPRKMKTYHMNHHFRIQDKGFGITTTLWDKLFGTFPASKVGHKTASTNSL